MLGNFAPLGGEYSASGWRRDLHGRAGFIKRPQAYHEPIQNCAAVFSNEATMTRTRLIILFWLLLFALILLGAGMDGFTAVGAEAVIR